MFEQVREMTTFSFFNNHIGCTAGVGKIPRSSGAGEESGWEMGVGELWVKDGVEGEKNSSRTAAQAPPPRTGGSQPPLKVSEDQQDACQTHSLKKVGGGTRQALRGPAGPVGLCL